jgi:hypothetical protein
MKLSLWIAAVNDEQKYVRAESRNHMDPTWQMHMQTLTRRKKVMEISEKIDQALYVWYSERGSPWRST